MMSDGTQCKQREVILIPFPYSDVSASKQRPALIVSNNRFNHKNQDVVVCMITSKPEIGDDDITLTMEDMDVGTITYDSKIKPHRLFTVSKAVVRKKIGSIKFEKASEVSNKIIELIKAPDR